MLVLFFAIAANAQFVAQSVGSQPINFGGNSFVQPMPVQQMPVYQPPRRVQTQCYTYWIGDTQYTKCDSE
jgi:hypothetical protein